MSNDMFGSLSNRGKHMHKFPKFFEGRSFCALDPYHPTTNSGGCIDLGLAENCLSIDLLSQKIRQLLSDYILPDMPMSYKLCDTNNTITSSVQEMKNEQFNQNSLENDFKYIDFTGHYELKKRLIHFFSKYIFRLCDPNSKLITFDENNFFVSNGSGGAIEMLAAILMDEGDYMMVSTPFYYAFERDIQKRMRCNILPVPLKFDNNNYSYEMDFDKLEYYLEKAKKEGKRVRSFMYCNPHNPTGVIFSKQVTKKLIQWCVKHQIHFISDELYSLSMFKHKEILEFESSFTVCHENSAGIPYFETFVHILYSFSKDFSLNGYRCGVLFSQNKALLQALKASAYLSSASSISQRLVAGMLDDDKWIENYIHQNQSRLTERCNCVIKILDAHGIPFVRPQSGFFVWINLLEAFQNNAKQLGIETAIDEHYLMDKILKEAKVNIVSGCLCESKEPGWFRICFSALPLKTTLIALDRIIKCLGLTPKCNEQ